MIAPMFVPYNITLTPGQVYDIYFYPYKMQLLEVFNNGNYDLNVMINDAGLPNSIVVYASGSRQFSASKPVFTRVGFYSVGAINVVLNASR